MTTKEWSNSHEQLDDLLKLLRRNGVAKYVEGTIEIQLFPKDLVDDYPDIEPSKFGKSVDEDYNEIYKREKLLADIQGEF